MQSLVLILILLTGCETTNAQLSKVNRAINSYNYIPEPRGEDYWKRPFEFYSDNGGDCEDFAVAKYDLLKYKYDVSILIGYLKPEGTTHAVLLVDDYYVLDNNHDDIYTVDYLRHRMDVLFVTNDRKELK